MFRSLSPIRSPERHSREWTFPRPRRKSCSDWGEEIAVRARVWTIGGFSAHGDQKELLAWLSAFRSSPTVFVTHGEEKAALIFADLVRERYKFTTNVPGLGPEFAL